MLMGKVDKYVSSVFVNEPMGVNSCDPDSGINAASNSTSKAALEVGMTCAEIIVVCAFDPTSLSDAPDSSLLSVSVVLMTESIMVFALCVALLTASPIRFTIPL